MAKDPQQPDLDPVAPDPVAAAAIVTGRLLLDTHINGNPYPINSVVILTAAHADSLAVQGALDTSAAAVAYATELGNTPIDLSA
ncbi:hypothetical protein [Sulfuriferula sp.]|uniref:hypothetical protein n=1 Tax=Sulfuriferula sp. TaxID=2025307 RepID=UPI00272FAE72|nr:hypothetical protein [Sulfuriferula sp.]MDP2026441.1 hypothetical protein [Sulfuriferula sp.]